MKKTFTLILICVLAICFTGIASAANWQWIASDNRFGVFFDTESFQTTAAKTYIYWEKKQPTEAYGEELGRWYKYNRAVGSKLAKVEVDYQNKKQRLLYLVDYDRNGSVIWNDSMSGEWLEIIPGSNGELHFYTTYEYYKTHFLTPTNTGDWRPIVSGSKGGWYFDAKSFRTTSPTTYVVKEKAQLLDGFVAKIPALKGSQPIFLMVLRMEYDYTNKKSRSLGATTYDKDGNVINSFDNTEDWAELNSNPIHEKRLNVTYTYYKKHVSR